MRILPLGQTGRKFCGVEEPGGAALMFELDDDTLAEVAVDRSYVMDRELVARCFAQRGRNAHFYLLYGCGGADNLRKYIDELLLDYHTVSWWTRLQKRFYIRRGSK